MPVKCRLRHDGTTLPVSGSATQVDKHGVFLVDQPGRHDLSKAEFHAATDAALQYHTIDLTACTCSVPTPASSEDNYDLFANSCAPATVCTTCNKAADVSSFDVIQPPGGEPPQPTPRTGISSSELRRIRRMRDILRPRWRTLSVPAQAPAAAGKKRRRTDYNALRDNARPCWGLQPDPGRRPGESRAAYDLRTNGACSDESCEQDEPTVTLRERLFDISDMLQQARVRLRRGTARSRLSLLSAGIFEGPRQQIKEWERRQASKTLIDQLSHGVRWPFDKELPPAWCCRGNNPGCFQFAAWLTAVIEELVALGIIREVDCRPWVVSPLNVVEKSGYDPVSNPFRLRLILDMRYVNQYMRAERFRMETLHRARCVFRQGDILLTIDMESGYWCMYVHDDHMMYMGFMWGGRYFVFVAMPFGAAASAIFFQTLTWTLSKWWRRRSGQSKERAAFSADGKPVSDAAFKAATAADPSRHICYLDDFGWGVDHGKVAATAAFLLNEFSACGLRVNLGKSMLPGHPDFPKDGQNKQAIMLGIMVDTERMRFVIPDGKRVKILGGIREALASFDAGLPISIRTLAKIVGRCMACHLVLGDAVRILTRFSYDLIARTTAVGMPPPARDDDDRELVRFDYADKQWRRLIRAAWNIEVHLSPDVAAEVTALAEVFDHTDLESPIHPVAQLSRVIVTTDSSDTATGISIDLGDGVRRFGHAALPPALLAASSTARELAGTERGLEVFAFLLDEVIDANDNPLAYGQVVVFIDNKSAARALRLGSANMDVHRRVQAVFQRAAVAGIDILSRWRPRDTQLVQEADDGSKWVDNCDYRLDTDVVHDLDAWAADHLRGGRPGSFVAPDGHQQPAKWMSVDRFASPDNAVLRRFNSVFYTTGGNGGDALIQDWSGDNNYAFPPYCLIGDTLAKLRTCRARGVVVVPFNTAYPWWPMVTRRRSNPHVVDTWRLYKRTDLISKAGCQIKLGAMPDFLAVLIDYGDDRPRLPPRRR